MVKRFNAHFVNITGISNAESVEKTVALATYGRANLNELSREWKMFLPTRFTAMIEKTSCALEAVKC